MTVVGDLIEYMEDDGNIWSADFSWHVKPRSVSLISTLFRRTEVFLREAVLAAEVPYCFGGRTSESNVRREDDVAMAEANGDIAPAGNMVVEGVTAEDGKSYIIDT